MNKLTLLAAVFLLGALNANVVKADAVHQAPNTPEAGMHPGFEAAPNEHHEGMPEVPQQSGY